MTKPKSKRMLKAALLLGTAISMFFVPWPIVSAWLKPIPDTVQEAVNEAIDNGFDGIIVYVDEAGKPPAFYTAGWHNTEKQIPARPDAVFKIASVSKLYIAVAVAKLAGSGRISLDSSLTDYFPELAGRIEYADRITVRMLVQHRSGIPNYTDTPNYWASPKETNEERLALVLDHPADFEPGEDYEYSNTNYLLLRELMHRVLGYGHFRYIREKILQPLGLTHTYASLEEVNIDDVMSGYYVGYEGDLKTDKQGMLATAQDLGVFLRALNDGTLFKEGEQEIYSSIYGYEHTGLIPGYQTIAAYHKDLDAVVVQFTNTVDFDGYNWNLSEIAYGRVVKILKRQAKD